LIKNLGCDDATLIQLELRQREEKEETNTLRIGSWIWFGRSTSGETLESSETEDRHLTPIFGRKFKQSIRLFKSILTGFGSKVMLTKTRSGSFRFVERGTIQGINNSFSSRALAGKPVPIPGTGRIEKADR
jgi:hypothetical protein